MGGTNVSSRHCRWWMLVAGAWLWVGCGSSQIMLEAPSTKSGQRYRCTQERGCALAEVDVPSRDKMPDAAYITLPEACEGRVHQVVIYRAESSDPEIGVTCAGKKPPAPSP